MTQSLLRARDLVVGYSDRPVLNGIDFDLNKNEVLCLLGHNGAGKSTLLKTLFGLIARQAGELSLDDTPLDVVEPNAMMAAGVSFIPEGHGIFPGLSVAENMRLGMWAAGIPEDDRAERVDWVFSVLPRIKEFYNSRAGTLSGGQQQMVSIGRALLSRPRILLMDEPSIGLAPKLFEDLIGPIRELQQSTDMSILLVEQNVHEALKVSDRVVVMKSGEMIWEGPPTDLIGMDKLRELY